MKMVKSLFLGSAAGLVAMTGAQAADLPVKAKPVQYVKICSLYGAGFYYIPGTDMCLKIGGWVRAEYAVSTNGSSVGSYNGDQNTRGTNNMWWRERGYITADARNQTEYGTVRSYIAVGLSTNTTGGDNAANQFDANKAFIQFAGFTFGRASSFFDFFPGAAYSYFGFFPQSDTGDGGQNVFAYTAQFGNGLSASISAETRRMTQLINSNNVIPSPPSFTFSGGSGTLAGSSFTASGSTVSTFGAYGGWQMPDVVGNLRLEQAWGAAQIMGAIHQVNAGYYGAMGATSTVPNVVSIASATDVTGHPADAYGWAVGGGLKINTPMIGAGDNFNMQVNYTQGALRYLFQNPGAGNMWLSSGNRTAMGVLSDGVYGGIINAGGTGAGATPGGTTTGIELTTAWGINAAYDHVWSKSWRTSVHGGYYAVSYDAAANNQLCSAQSRTTTYNPAGTSGSSTAVINSGAGNQGLGSAALADAGCNNNWTQWWIGSRTQFNLDASTYLGLDVAYTQIKGLDMPNGLITGGGPTGSSVSTGNPYSLATMGNWQARFRVHRDFYP